MLPICQMQFITFSISGYTIHPRAEFKVKLRLNVSYLSTIYTNI